MRNISSTSDLVFFVNFLVLLTLRFGKSPLVPLRPVLTLLARRDISEGEELTISYCAPLLSTRERRRRLQRSKGFRCLCRRCGDPTELGSHLGSLRCTKCAEGIMADLGEEFRCGGCGFSAPEAKGEALLKAVGDAQGRLMEKQPAAGEDHWDKLLRSHSKRLPPTNHLILELKHYLLAALERSRGRCGRSNIRRRKELLAERMLVLKSVDGEASRLMGFLLYRMQGVLAEVVAAMQREGTWDMEKEECRRLAEDMHGNLRAAAALLLGDARCPKELESLATGLQ